MFAICSYGTLSARLSSFSHNGKRAGISWYPLAGYDFGISESLFVHDYGTIGYDWGFWAKITERQVPLVSQHLLVASIDPDHCYPRFRHRGGDSKRSQSTVSSVQNEEAEQQVDTVSQPEQTMPCPCCIGRSHATIRHLCVRRSMRGLFNSMRQRYLWSLTCVVSKTTHRKCLQLTYRYSLVSCLLMARWGPCLPISKWW